VCAGLVFCAGYGLRSAEESRCNRFLAVSDAALLLGWSGYWSDRANTEAACTQAERGLRPVWCRPFCRVIWYKHYFSLGRFGVTKRPRGPGDTPTATDLLRLETLFRQPDRPNNYKSRHCGVSTPRAA
jgi:hypothetical protein